METTCIISDTQCVGVVIKVRVKIWDREYYNVQDKFQYLCVL